MYDFNGRFSALAGVLALAACQATGGEGAVAKADGPAGRCITEAATKYGVPAGEVAISAEYPFGGSGTAIDGSVNSDLSGIMMFRCEYDPTGGFLRIVEPKPGE